MLRVQTTDTRINIVSFSKRKGVLPRIKGASPLPLLKLKNKMINPKHPYKNRGLENGSQRIFGKAHA